jgi:hypothetical protein
MLAVKIIRGFGNRPRSGGNGTTISLKQRPRSSETPSTVG